MPVKSFRTMNADFYKNGEERTGAQKEAIITCPDNEVCVGFIRDTGTKRGWGHMTPQNLLEHTKTNNHLYEMISKYPHKVYLDIDKYGTPEEAGLPYLKHVKTILEEYFPNADIAVSGSITDKKTSFHLVLNNYMIHNDDERDQLAMIIKNIKNTDDGFDHTVYSKNRLMKAINQSKPDGRIQKIIENDDPKKHFITCFFSENRLTFDYLPEQVKELLSVKKQGGKGFNIGLLPDVKLTVPDNFDIKTVTATEILEMLPNTAECDFTYRHLVMRFCVTNDIPYDNFIAWICKRHAHKMTPSFQNDKNQQWTTHWKTADQFPPKTIDSMRPILKKYYPNLFRDKYFKDFRETFDLPIDKIEKIETITPKCYSRDEKCLVFNVGMGGGKTAQTISYLQKKKQIFTEVTGTGEAKKFLWLAPNKALASNTMKRFEDEGVRVNHYEQYTTAQKKANIMKQEADNIIICLNSIHYLEGKQYDILIIDEIETVVDKFLGDFLEGKETKQLKKSIWNTFVNLFKNSKKIILLDAFITTKTLNLLKLLEIDYRIFERINEKVTRTVKYMNAPIAMVDDLINKLKDGKKVFIFYPLKKSSGQWWSMEALYQLISMTTGKKGRYYNANIDDTRRKELKDVNKHWSKYDFVIINNIVTCGVNYEEFDYDCKYIFIASHNSPRDIVQISHRVRFLKSNLIKVAYLGRMTASNTWLNDCYKINDPIYTNLYNGILIERMSPLKKTFQFFCQKAHYKQETDDYKINELVEKELQDDLTKCDMTVYYNDIPELTELDVDKIQKKCIIQEASMLEKYQLNKYYFKNSFTEDVESNTLAEIWDDKYQMTIRRIGTTLIEEQNVFNAIARHNNLTQLFPTDILKTKLTDELIDDIFKEFSFKFVSKKSSSQKIVKEIYNMYFGKHLIRTEYTSDSNNVATYVVDENVYKYYEFVKKFLIIDHSNYMTYEQKSGNKEDEIDINSECFT